MRSLLPALLTGLPLAACGGGPPPPDALGRLERPALEAIVAASEMPTEVVDRLPVPDGLGKWVASGRTATTPLGSDGARIVAFGAGEGPAQLRIPGRFPAQELDWIRIRGSFPGGFRVTVQLGGEQAKPFRPPTLGTRNEQGEQELAFDLAKMRGSRARFDWIDVYVQGPPRAFALHAVETVDAPDGNLLPRPGEAPDAIDLDSGEGRCANGLTTDGPVRCQFRVEHGADRLGFAVALAPRMRPWGGDPRVVVRLGPPGGDPELEKTIELEGDRKTPLAWHEVELPLERFVGRDVEARFEYICDAPQPGAVALAGVQVWRPRLDPPTVVLVSSDTHRADHVRAAGLGVEIDTPALDALAAEGVLFERCWATTNVTSPSHVAMLTGIHPRDTRLVTNIDRLAPGAETLAERFREAGWATLAAVSVRHLGPRGTNLGQGFDRILAPLSEPWDAEVPVDALLEWMEAEEGKPLFVFLHLFDAHHPYTPPGDFDRRYYPAGKDPADPSLPPLDVREGGLPADMIGMGLRDLEFPRAQYRGEVSYLDGQLGRLFRAERVASGVIAVTADHGEILEKDGTYFNHGELFPDTLHVPLILGGGALPPDARGTRVAARVPQLDLPRTLLDLANLGGVEFPGRNLLSSVDLEPAEAPPVFALSAHGSSASVARGDMFLLLHLRNHKALLARERVMHEVELFDLASDPECLRNLAEQRPELRDELRALLVEWLADTSPVGLSTKRVASEAELQKLAELGYATDAVVVEDEPWYDPERSPEKDGERRPERTPEKE